MGGDSYPTSEEALLQGYNQTLEPVMGANETMASTVAPIVDAEMTGVGGGGPATESPAATTAAAAAAAAANEESVLKTSANVDIFDYLVIPSIQSLFFIKKKGKLGVFVSDRGVCNRRGCHQRVQSGESSSDFLEMYFF